METNPNLFILFFVVKKKKRIKSLCKYKKYKYKIC